MEPEELFHPIPPLVEHSNSHRSCGEVKTHSSLLYKICVSSLLPSEFPGFRNLSLSKKVGEQNWMTWKVFKNSLDRGITEIPGGHWEVRGWISSRGGAIYHVQLMGQLGFWSRE